MYIDGPYGEPMIDIDGEKYVCSFLGTLFNCVFIDFPHTCFSQYNTYINVYITHRIYITDMSIFFLLLVVSVLPPCTPISKACKTNLLVVVHYLRYIYVVIVKLDFIVIVRLGDSLVLGFPSSTLYRYSLYGPFFLYIYYIGELGLVCSEYGCY